MSRVGVGGSNSVVDPKEDLENKGAYELSNHNHSTALLTIIMIIITLRMFDSKVV